MALFCPECGKQASSSQLYCSSCGADLARARELSLAKPRRSAGRGPSSKSRAYRLVLAFFVVVIIAGLVAIALALAHGIEAGSDHSAPSTSPPSHLKGETRI